MLHTWHMGATVEAIMQLHSLIKMGRTRALWAFTELPRHIMGVMDFRCDWMDLRRELTILPDQGQLLFMVPIMQMKIL